jgi:hypothetical protein
VMAMSDDVLPVAVQADLPAVPEMNALIPVAALVVLLTATNVWRKRRRSA